MEISRQEIICAVLPTTSRAKFVNSYTNVFLHNVYDIKVTESLQNIHGSGTKGMNEIFQYIWQKIYGSVRIHHRRNKVYNLLNSYIRH